MGRAAGSFLANYIGKYLHSRTKRDATTNANEQTTNSFKQFVSVTAHETNDESAELPKLTEEQQHAFHGGERAILYGVVEDLLSTFGLNGKACLLRTICEVHSKSVHHLGLFGEMAKLFFT